jgi:O-antigen biosynthesis protein
MLTGTPSVTTTIGAEAMKGDLSWNGIIEDDLTTFAEQAAQLCQHETEWHTAQQHGVQIINERYAVAVFADPFMQRVNELFSGLTKHRQNNFLGQILNHHTAQSTKYMSLWIEEKNK